MRAVWRKYSAGAVLVPMVLLALEARACLEQPPQAGRLTAALAATSAADDAASRPAAKKSSHYARVEEGVYVGDRVSKPPEGTQAVLCLCESKDAYQAQVEVWRWRPIRDGGPAPSLEWLRDQVAFVAAQRQAGRQVYVHCAAGISRAPMVTTAYLMSEHHWSRDQALAFVRKNRKQASPNHYFMALLLKWQDALKDAATKPADDQAGATSPAASAAENAPAQRSVP